MESKNPSKSNVIKIIVCIILIIAGVAYGYNTYKKYTTGIPQQIANNQGNPGNPGNNPPKGNQPPQRNPQQFRERMAKELDLTTEQQKQMDALMAQGRPTTPEEFQKRREATDKILTPQQKEKMQKNMQARAQQRIQQRLKEASKVLTPEQLDELKKKMEDRMKRWTPPPPPPSTGNPPPSQ